jgi:hypothetical protein
MLFRTGREPAARALWSATLRVGCTPIAARPHLEGGAGVRGVDSRTQSTAVRPEKSASRSGRRAGRCQLNDGLGGRSAGAVELA